MKRYFFLFLLLLFSLGGYVFVAWYQFSDNQFVVVFCDVGQGDAIFLRTPQGKDILIDGGPDERVLSCLSSHMPFWDRDIDIVMLSHPHADHLNGLIAVLRHYTVGAFITEDIRNETEGYRKLFALLSEHNVPQQHVSFGKRLTTPDGVSIRVLGPSGRFLKETSPGGVIGEKKEFASLITLVSYGRFTMLLTGDSQVVGMHDALSHLSQPVSVLHIPHHGSRFGLNEEIIKKLSPDNAVMSVGKNTYGHPSPQIITMLQKQNVRWYRTDEDGEIVIKSDGDTSLVGK